MNVPARRPDRIEPRMERLLAALRADEAAGSVALLEVADDAARLAVQGEMAAGRHDLAFMIQDGARHAVGQALAAAEHYAGPLCGAVGDATGLLTCVLPSHDGTGHRNALGTGFDVPADGVVPNPLAAPLESLPTDMRERIGRMAAADAERLAYARAFLDAHAGERVFTIADMRDAIRANTRANRRGEEPGEYAFPGVPTDEISDYAAFGVARRKLSEMAVGAAGA